MAASDFQMGQDLLTGNFWTLKPMTRRILITIEYDGGPFVGWQHQENGPVFKPQSKMQQRPLFSAGNSCGAGRTDAGVHAIGQAAHIDVPEKFTAIG